MATGKRLPSPRTSRKSPTQNSSPSSVAGPTPEQPLTPEQLRAAALHLESLPTPPTDFRLERILFAQQLPFGLDTSRYQTAVTPRRAGKTYAIAAKLLSVALAKRGCVALYITLSRINAKRIVWETLKEMNRLYALGGLCGEADLSVTFPNGSRVFLSGASDKGEVEKFRGLALGIVIIDEAQSFPAYLEQLVDEVLAPALTDYSGTMALVGTPGPVPIGYFHDRCSSHAWTHHGWSVFDNVFLERKSGRPTRQLLADELARRGVDESDPVIQREWFGRWVLDSNSLVFRYDAKANNRRLDYHDEYVVGVDLGFDDADAIAVLGWSLRSPACELVYEWVGAKQTISALMAKVAEVYARYKPHAVVADTGGLGKKIAEEIQARLGLPIEAADKARKLEHIELLNDALRTGLLYAPSGGRFAQDCLLVEWDRSNPEKPCISERYHSDICDAVLYAWRRAQAWLYEAPKLKPPAINTPEWFEAQMKQQQQELDEMLERDIAEHQQQRDEERELEW